MGGGQKKKKKKERGGGKLVKSAYTQTLLALRLNFKGVTSSLQVYSIRIEELVNGNWEVFKGTDVQLEFFRIDPFIRITLNNSNGLKLFHDVFGCRMDSLLTFSLAMVF